VLALSKETGRFEEVYYNLVVIIILTKLFHIPNPPAKEDDAF